MIFKVGEQVFYPSETPVAIIFINNEDKKRLISALNTIEDKPEDSEDGGAFAIHPGTWEREEFIKFTTLTEEELHKGKSNPDSPVRDK